MDTVSLRGVPCVRFTESERKVFDSSIRLNMSDGLPISICWTGQDFLVFEPVTGVILGRCANWLKKRKKLENGRLMPNQEKSIRDILSNEDTSSLLSTVEKDVEGLRRWIIAKGLQI